jgi:hypothetical protein
MRANRSPYKRDRYYPKITAAVTRLLKDRSTITPVDVFMQMGYLTKEDYENWRFGGVPYLERVIKCNLSKINRMLRILKIHVEDRGLRASQI